MNNKHLGLLIVIVLTCGLFSGCVGQEKTITQIPSIQIPSIYIPSIEITSPQNGMTLSNLVLIRGNASDPEGNRSVVNVQVKIDNGTWNLANGTMNWSFHWGTSPIPDGPHTISARSWDGSAFSKIESISIEIMNPKTVESNTHKWAVFIIAANFPKDNSSKLGNGGLYLAENMTAFFIENLSYSTSHIIILFDDGWIRADNGYGNPIEPLQQRSHPYNITYAGATQQNVSTTLQQVVEASNHFDDSEVFIWIFDHGYGDTSKPITGGKILQPSAVSLWDGPLIDQDLGNLLINLKSQKTCIIVDACYSGGFADKTIYNLPESFFLNPGIAQPGRIVITGTSKLRSGYAITTLGPVFSLIWFEALKTGYADGFKPGLLHLGGPPTLDGDKDGQTSVEEAFYYTCFMLRNDNALVNFKMMEPQMNDQYPGKGPLNNVGDMLL